MVRTREFDPVAALDKVVELFAAKGYGETSMEDIVKATGVSRYGLYGTFGNKRELFEQALERFADEMGRKSFLKLLEPGASLADVRRIFDERIDSMCQGKERFGCLLSHTALELAPHDAEIKAVVQRFMRRTSKTFAIGIETAQQAGEVREDVDPKAAGDFLTGALFGLVVMARGGFARSSLKGYVENTLAALRCC